MNLLERVLCHLKEHKGRFSEVSEGSGVPKDTIHNISQRKTKNPRYLTLQKLDDYFAKQQEVSTP